MIPTKTFQQFVSDMATSWGDALDVSPVLPSGDPALAIFQACAAQLDFQTACALALVLFGRASTATGSDLDSFYAQFGFYRLAATNAGFSGDITFGTTTPNANAAYVPVDTLVSTTGANAIQYTVIADVSQSAYNNTLSAYVLPASQTTLAATIQAVNPGSASNVQAGQLVQINSSLSGITYCTNASAIINGADAESDEAFRARFIVWVNSRTLGTEDALLAAALGVQTNLDVVIYPNTNLSNVQTPGTNIMVVDNGTGSPPSSLIQEVQAAIVSVNALGIQTLVYAPVLETVTIASQVRLPAIPSETNAIIEANAEAAILAYVNGLTIGAPLYISELISVVQAADPNILSVNCSGTTINSSNADYTPPFRGIVRTILSDIAVTTYS